MKLSCWQHLLNHQTNLSNNTKRVKQMKLLYNGMEITCTVDEFEDLITRGLIPGRDELIERNKDDDWIEMIRRLTPEKPKDAVDGRNWPPTVALYGVEMSQPTYTTSQATTRLDNEQQT